MPSPLKFHLDECVFEYHAIAKTLRQYGIDVTIVPDVNLLSAPDHVQLYFASVENRVLFTLDADYLKMNLLPINHAGIIYCHQRKHTVGEIIKYLKLYWETYSAEEMTNKLEYL